MKWLHRKFTIEQTRRGDWFLWKNRLFVRISETLFAGRTLHVQYPLHLDKIKAMIKEERVIVVSHSFSE